MTRYWNLKTNEFQTVSEEAVTGGNYRAIETLEGDRVYVETNLIPAVSSDGVISGGVTKQEGLSPDVERVIEKTWEACSDVLGPESYERWRAGFVDDANAEREVAFWACVCYLVQQFSKGRPSDVRQDVFAIAFASLQDRRIEPKRLSKSRASAVREAAKSISWRDACSFFGGDIEHMLQDYSENAVSIYLKAFAKEGVGFVLGRVMRQSSSRLARFPVEAQSAEVAELELLNRLLLAAFVTNAGGHLDIYSSQRNIVDWLRGDALPASHLELRAQIINSLAGFSTWEPHWMDEETRSAYRREKSL